LFLLGYAYQLGHVPIGSAAIEQAIELNGAAVEMSRNAFRFGRLAAREPGAIARLIGTDTTTPPKAQTLEVLVAFRTGELTKYQDAALAERYHARVTHMAEIERKMASGRSGLAEAVARAYYKLLAYKDEYEVARLYADPAFDKALGEVFESRRKLEFHLAPPLLARRDRATGEPRKIRFGAWMLPLFRVLAKGKRLRGTAFDVFGYTRERKLERQMIADYEKLLDEIAERLSPATHANAVALASLPLDIKGFGHIKQRNFELTKARQATLLNALRNPSPSALKAAE
jgi:indolepyruvate ferredoxin oxidoreductase